MTMGLTTGFIGAGNVGFTLGKYFAAHGIPVAGYYSRSAESTRKAAVFSNSTAYTDLPSLIETSDILFLTVPDDQISPVFREVSRYDIRSKFVCHTSGALTTQDAFPGMKTTGAFCFSVHPLFAVSDRYHAYEELSDVFFVLETDPRIPGSVAALRRLTRLLESAGLHTQTIRSDRKAAYHLAASVASNLVVALMDVSIELLEDCGFPEDAAREALTPLAMGNLRHILRDGTIAALTGPIDRGDAGTVKKHLAALTDPTLQEFYRLLSRRLLTLAKEKHPERDYEPVQRLLDDRDNESFAVSITAMKE